LFQAVIEAIETLPLKEQQVIRAYLDGKSYDEIARQHGLSYKGATNRVYRAREKILRKIQQLLHLIFPFGKLQSLFVKKGGGVMKVALTTKILITLGCVMIVGFAGYGIITSITPDNPDSNTLQGVIRESDETVAANQAPPSKRDFVSKQTQPAFEESLEETQPEELVEDEQFLADGSEEDLRTELADISDEIEEESPEGLMAEVELPEEAEIEDTTNTGEMSGWVTDVTRTLRIAGATVLYTGPANGQIFTDENGEFKIYNLPPGDYTLDVRKAGYMDRLALTATVMSDATFIMEILMAENRR